MTHFDLMEFLALSGHWGALAPLVLLMQFLAVPSGTPIPAVESLLLAVALRWAPEWLHLADTPFQQLGAGLLLVWVVACWIMVIRFFLSKNWYIDWNYPALVQLMRDSGCNLSKRKIQ